ncbi:lauroyl acyltransferase [Acinetobacter qingfengensis]|uniref:Lipid A biosynthesis acyltransferase n=1 Tax=Acinetobacter qingfengensis TaxID=1262585 RepID=A0A1E7R1D5_9GAMM|nr:lauroyl acyltransferase [Acinetobacter qingfengensis]KAA8733247.1 lauroyl acyltransferase [Acinetobacter qingfengensis]OEY93120.1 lauroyl acyltransferase [Acinetobacter qingfengensis]
MSNITQHTAAQPRFLWSFLLPKYWGIWLGLIFLLLLTVLPWVIQRRLADVLAKLAWRLVKSRRDITVRNLEVCFPEWSAQEVQQHARQVFIDMMLGTFETLNAWYKPHWFDGRINIQGLEYLQQAQMNGAGIILLGSHSTLLDAGGYICSRYFEPDVVYRPQNNPLLDWLIYTAREPIYGKQIDHDDIRFLVKRLKQGHIIWYSPDQDFGLKQGVMAPFFGVPAASVTAQRRLVKVTKAKVLSVHFYRIGEKDPKYQIIIEPELENYPTTDEIADATRVNQLLEMQLRRAPTQWMWFHSRFKTRPKGYDSIY